MQEMKGYVLFALMAMVLTFTGSVSLASETKRIWTVEEQRSAILDCRYEMGLRGRSRFGGEWPETPMGGQTIIWIVPGSNLSHSDADRINSCADERLGRYGSPQYGQDIANTNHTGCTPGAPVLLGGATYCIGTN